jgi:hypothetical protein
LNVDTGNAGSHSAQITQNFFTDNSLPRPAQVPYSADLWPADFHLFVKVKKDLIGKSSREEEELCLEVMETLSGISANGLQEAFHN